jgi:hypothetical protein
VQDRYVGDVGDFAKYALLRSLVGRSTRLRIRLGIVWCLFPNETHNNDGRHISYLHKAEFKALDDPLLEALDAIIASGNGSLSALSSSRIFQDDTVFYEAVTAASSASLWRNDRLQHRAGWLDRALSVTSECNLVFFDPDNGLEVSSVPKHHRNAGKYIYWDDLAPFWRRGQALLVYHHLNRTKPAARQVSDLRDQFKTQLKGASALPLVFRRGSCRVFWLVYRSSATGAELERRARAFLTSAWSLHFPSADWLDEKRVATVSVV